MDKEEEIVANEEEKVEQEVVANDDLAERIKANEEKFGKAKWYALHTFSGYENVAKDNLETVVTKFNLQDRIFDIIIPMESVVEEKKGKKVLVERKSMPCYIFVKMIYGDDLWHNVTRTRGITGFVGPNGRPLSLTEEEVRKNKLEVIKVNVDVVIGDKVEIIDGPLEGTIGTISEVNAEAGTATVMVEMFGREAPVDLELAQMRKI
jgi:transcriptional antiterminator NusG